MASPSEHPGYRPGEDVTGKVPGHLWDSVDIEKPMELQDVEAKYEIARALWAIAFVLDELRDDVIDGP